MKAPTLIPDPAKQLAIKTMRKMRAAAASMMALRDAIRSKGFAMSREMVGNILASGVEGGAVAHWEGRISAIEFGRRLQKLR